jgi:hypothetical protein
MADILLRELQQAPVGHLHNEDTGWDFVISKLDRKKMGINPDLSHSDSQAISGILSLVTHAVLAETHSDKEHKNPDVKAIHRFYAPVVIDSVNYRVKLTVKDYAFTDGREGRRNLHAIETIELEKENALLGTLPSYSTPSGVRIAQPTTERTISISKLLKNATRDSDGQPFEVSP